MGLARQLIAQAMEQELAPFGMVEVGGAVFGQLMDELVNETKQLNTTITRDSMIVSLVMPDGTVVYLNPRLHPGDVLVSNVAGHS